MDAILIALATLGAAGLGALATRWVASRQFSGQIESSEAESLWAESRSIREWSSKRIDFLVEQNAHLHAELDKVRDRYEAELRATRERCAMIEQELRDLRAKHER